MKVYYKQSDKNNTFSPFAKFSITHCYLKHLYIDHDAKKVTRKAHHHNSFEIHIIEKGHQEYVVDGKIFSVHSGEFFFVPPFVKHKVINSKSGTEKYSITFTSAELGYFSECTTGCVPERFFENVRFIADEYHNNKMISDNMIENSVFENTVLLLRICGLHEKTTESKNEAEDLRLESVKEYIADNIESWITVNDIAAYCYLSPKQVTRIFLKYEGLTPSQYVNNCRIAHIQKLLENDELSLKSISDKMNFQNEYYFNSFVKKHLGMPPGTYRRMNK